MDEVNRTKMGQHLSDQEAMTLAIQAATKGLGFVSPNPAVGCVILDQKNSLISVGYHEKYGGPHAEINALRGLTPEQLTGARVFVTLEPCAHYGKTPPCAEALAKLPISEVIFGLYDPNPLVQGKGAAIVQAAGIRATHYNQSSDALERVCEHFLKNMRTQLPFVSLKIGTSLDGKIALKNGQSQWITGSESREEAHRLRAQHDAMVVGVGTFLHDNPSLNIRHPQFPDKINRVCVLDPQGRGVAALASSKLYSHHQPQDIFWAISAKEQDSLRALKGLGVQTLEVSTIEGSSILNLQDLLKQLWAHSVRSVLVEGGGHTVSHFINQKMADRLYLFVAPLIIGETGGIGWTSHLNRIDFLNNSVKMGSFEMSSIGKDLLLTNRFL
jgi:diaminohydroxyphosphoribosylaminopyrimidine deaminase/5-amino-6-(5-phosphoribosylamino)uracil reductase